MMRLFVALFVLLFTQWFTTSAAAAPAHKISADQRKSAASHSQHAERKKRKSEHGSAKQRSATHQASAHVQRTSHSASRPVTATHASHPPGAAQILTRSVVVIHRPHASRARQRNTMAALPRGKWRIMSLGATHRKIDTPCVSARSTKNAISMPNRRR